MALNAVDDPIEGFADVGSSNWLVPERTYSQERVQWAEKWRELPVYTRKNELSALIRSFTQNEVTVLVAGTGSGKTVLAPPIMLWTLTQILPKGNTKTNANTKTKTNANNASTTAYDDGPRVVVTMPKQAVVRSAAATSAMTLDALMGEHVGYKYRGSPSNSTSSRVRALYATDGTLLAMARHDPRLMKYDAVMMDEVHERPVPTDLLLQAVRNAILIRRDTDRPLRLVVMSATIDPAPFIEYYSKPGLSVGLVEFPAKPNYPVSRTFLKSPSTNPVTDAIDTAVGILNDPKSAGKVIIFVPTTRDAVGGCPAFEVTCSKSKNNKCAQATCSPLYGRQNKDEQLTALLNDSASASASSQRVYVATNIAESSLTIKGVDHVIDTGLQVSSIWRPLWHGTELMIHIASRAQLEQRMGRTGRTAPGQAHLMYTKSQYDALPAFPEPTILQVDITEPILTLLRSGSDPSLDAAIGVLQDLLTPPSTDQIQSAIAYLTFYGLVDHEITPLGRTVASIISDLKVSIDNAILLAFAAQLQMRNVVVEALDLVAILESSRGGVEPLWRSANGRSSPRPDKALRRFLGNSGKGPIYSDHVALVTILNKVARAPQQPMNKFLSPKLWRDILSKASALQTPRVIDRLLWLTSPSPSQSKPTSTSEPASSGGGAGPPSDLLHVILRARGFHRCQQRLKDSQGLLPAPIAAINDSKNKKVMRALMPWFIDASGSEVLDVVYETYAKSATSTGRAFVITRAPTHPTHPTHPKKR